MSPRIYLYHVILFFLLVLSRKNFLFVFFFGLLHIEEGKKICMNNILNINMEHEKIKTIFWQVRGIWFWWSIDYDRQTKWIFHTFKREGKYFFNSIHCVVYKTNLSTMYATKIGPCKDMSRKIDALLSSVTMHFKKSCNRKSALLRL